MEGTTLEGPTFEGVVRGYKAMEADPELAAVIVELWPGMVVPEAACFRLLKAARRQADGLKLERAVACITDRWQAVEIGTGWRDQWAWVGVGADGKAVFEQFFPAMPF